MIGYRSIAAATIGAALAFAAGVATADPIADFYKGRSVRIVVGYGEGGGYDLYARLASLHLGRSIPGNPTVISQNMPGAGSALATRFVYNAAPKDGTVLGMVSQALAADAVLEGAKDYDVTKLVWIGRITTNIDVGLTLHSAKAKSLEDAKQREVVIGGLGAATNSVMAPTLLNALLGTKFKIIQGYKSSADVSLAAERGEVEAVAAIGWAGIKASRPEWLGGERRVNVLYQIARERSADLPNAPAMGELGSTPEARAILRFFGSSSDMGRSLFVSPEVPTERVQALLKAFQDMLKDPAFLEDVKKRNIDVESATGPKVAEIVAETMATPKDVVERMKTVLGRKGP